MIDAAQSEHLERRTMRKVTMRIVPFLMVAYFLAYLDRINIGFAALEMNRDLGLTSTVYGWAAGIFFLAYIVFEIPSNLIMERVGARIWIARIMISWGLVTAATAFVVGPTSLFFARFMLGFAEAGFFPGALLYLTYWCPAAYRAKIIASFSISVPLSGFVGSPISARCWVSMGSSDCTAGSGCSSSRVCPRSSSACSCSSIFRAARSKRRGCPQPRGTGSSKH